MAKAIAPTLVALLALPAAGSDWPQFLGPARNGTSGETGLLQTWPAKGPPVLWQKAVGEGYSGPVVSGGRLVLFHLVEGEEVVECLEAATGKPLWRFGYASSYQDDYGKGNGPRATPLVDGPRVYALGAGGVLTCLDLAGGMKVWQHNLSEEYQPRKGFFGVATSPLVEGDLLVVNVGARGAGVVAFRKDTGREVWKATDQEASYASPVAATVGGVRHLLFFTREGLVSLDPARGEVRFRKRWRSRNDASVNAATPLVVGDHIFLTASYGTGAVLLRARKDAVEEIWKGDEILSCHYDTPLLKDGYLYGCDGRQEQGARLRCVELATGKVRWTRDGFGCASGVLAEGNLVLLTEDGNLVLAGADPGGYREKARAAVLTRPCRAPLALANGLLYGRDERRLVCWGLKK